MRRLAMQHPIWHRSYGLIAQLLGAGEAALGWAYSFRIERMKKDGAPVDWVNTFDPILQNVTGIGISAKPNNPNTARLFIDFVLSKRGQEMIRDMLRVPGRSDVKPLVSKMDPAKLKLKQAPREVFIHFDQHAKEFREIFGL
jgi:iron(III) transport system substrate-binding protein